MFGASEEADRLAARAAGQDTGVAMLALTAWVLCILGQIDEAVSRMGAALEREQPDAIELPFEQPVRSGEAVLRYVDEWIVAVTDVTAQARTIHARLVAGDETGAADLLPVEAPYPLPAEVAAVIGATPAEAGGPPAGSRQTITARP